jgi:hypothetical protein
VLEYQSSLCCDVRRQYLLIEQKETSHLRKLNIYKGKNKMKENAFLKIMPSYLSAEIAP